MQVYFIENENPICDSSGGIMSYISDLSQYLMQKDSRTVLLGSGKIDNGISSFSEFISVDKSTKTSNLRYFVSLIKKLAIFPIDRSAIIHAQRPDMLFPFILFRKKNLLICTLHGAHDIAVFDKKGSIYGYIYEVLQKKSFKRADMLIAVDQGTKNYYLKKYPWLGNKVVVIPVGVDLKKFVSLDGKKLREKYGFSLEDKIIIFIGRIEKEKNLSMLIEAFGNIKRNLSSAKLVIVGKGRDELLIRSRIKSLHVEDVILMGEVNKERIPELLNCADVFAFCSLYEGSPTVIKEALACNLPVVSVDVGDVREVLQGIDGCYIAERDIDDFSGKILRVLKENKRVNSRERMIQFSSDHISRKTWNIYTSLLTQTKV